MPYDPELRPDPATRRCASRSFRYVWPAAPAPAGLLAHPAPRRRPARGGAPAVAALLPLRGAGARPAGAPRAHRASCTPTGSSPTATSRRGRRGAPACAIAITLHGSDVFMAERNPLFGRLARRALRDAAYVTSCSAELRDRLLRVAGAAHAAKIHLVANGTDPVPLGAGGGRWRERLGIAPDAPLVVAAGRLVDKKGFDVLIDAAPALRERSPRRADRDRRRRRAPRGAARAGARAGRGRHGELHRRAGAARAPGIDRRRRRLRHALGARPARQRGRPAGRGARGDGRGPAGGGERRLRPAAGGRARRDRPAGAGARPAWPGRGAGGPARRSGARPPTGRGRTAAGRGGAQLGARSRAGTTRCCAPRRRRGRR